MPRLNQEVRDNFNRQIRISFVNEETGDKFKVECPVRGRKPNIQISGTLLPVDYMGEVEISIINLYIEKGRTFQKVIIEAGYENSMSVAFEGEITNIYDESPGPEKVTVITCTQCRLSNLMGETISLDLAEGFSLSSALKQITDAAKLDPPIVPQEMAGVTSSAPFTFNGTVQEAIHEIKGLFPGVYFLFTDKTIKVTTPEFTGSDVPKIIEFLQAPPQVTGTTVIIKAPWDPGIKPGDVVSIRNVSYVTRGSISVGTLVSKYLINSIEFRFSSVQGANSMTLQGFYPEGA